MGLREVGLAWAKVRMGKLTGAFCYAVLGCWRLLEVVYGQVRSDRRFEALIYGDERMNSGSDFARTMILFRTMHCIHSVASIVRE